MEEKPLTKWQRAELIFRITASLVAIYLFGSIIIGKASIVWH